MQSIATEIDTLLTNPKVTLDSPLSDVRGVSGETAEEYSEPFPDDDWNASLYGVEAIQTIRDLLYSTVAFDHPAVPSQWRIQAAIDLLTTPITSEYTDSLSEADLTLLRYTSAIGQFSAEPTPGHADISEYDHHSGWYGTLFRQLPDVQNSVRPTTVVGPIESNDDQYVFFTTANEAEALLTPSVRDKESYTRILRETLIIASLLFRVNFALPENRELMTICEPGTTVEYDSRLDDEDFIVTFSHPKSNLAFAARTTGTRDRLLERFLTEQMIDEKIDQQV